MSTFLATIETWTRTDIPAWDAHAVSVSVMLGAGWFRFQVPTANVGCVNGLYTGAALQQVSDVDYGIRVWRGEYSVSEYGEEKTARVSFGAVSELEFSIIRFEGSVYYCVGDTPGPHTHPEIPIQIPNRVFHISRANLWVPVRLGTFTYAFDDRVYSRAV